MAAIYHIVNKINGNFYIGSTINPMNRWKAHRSELNRNVHRNVHLQNAWNLYGESAFVFEVLEECTTDQISHREQEYLDSCVGRSECYNILPFAYAPGRGRIWTLEERQKAKENHSNVIFTNSRKRNISLAKTGHTVSDATKEKLRSVMKRIDCRKNKFSDEMKQEMRTMFKSGLYTQKAIAEKFGCSQGHVRRILFDIKRHQR